MDVTIHIDKIRIESSIVKYLTIHKQAYTNSVKSQY